MNRSAPRSPSRGAVENQPQVKPDDTVLFKRLTLEAAYKERLVTDAMVAAVRSIALQVGWGGADRVQA